MMTIYVYYIICFVFFLMAAASGGELRLDMDAESLKLRPLESFVELRGGEFFMGTNDKKGGINHEYPQRKAIVKPFRIHLYPVSIASFRKFKREKFGHSTDAEKAGNSWVFRSLIPDTAKIHRPEGGNQQNEQLDEGDIEAMSRNMIRVQDARWNRPEGGRSRIDTRLNYPVTHVSYNDAFAYCAWKKMRLPTEIEWEYAARGGLKEKHYPWGDNWQIKRTNLWQGNFPKENQLRDGYYGLAPVDAFKEQNAYEMYDLIGNAWEWTSTIFRNLYSTTTTTTDESSSSGVVEEIRRTLKGGSFMDARDGDDRLDGMKIRISTRIGRRKNFTAQNIGFRCVQPIEDESELDRLDGKSFRVVRLRPPIHHHADQKKSHFLHNKHEL